MNLATQRRIAAVVLVGGIVGLLAGGAAVIWSPDAVSQDESAVLTTPEAPGSSGPSTTFGPPLIIDNRLFVVGDSVMQGAAPFLPEALPQWSIISDTQVGRFLEEGARVVERRQRQLGDVVVVGLGNNYNGDRTEFAEQVDSMLDELAGVQHILWVTVSEFRDDRKDVNAVLRSAARGDARVELVDWTPMWRADPTLTSKDRLHLSGEGAQAMASLIARSLNTLMLTTNQRPAPNPEPPKLNQRGSIPGDARSSSPSTPSRRPTTTAIEPATTIVPSTSPTTPAPTSTPPTSNAPVSTLPPSTASPSTVPLTSPPTEPPVFGDGR